MNFSDYWPHHQISSHNQNGLQNQIGSQLQNQISSHHYKYEPEDTPSNSDLCESQKSGLISLDPCPDQDKSSLIWPQTRISRPITSTRDDSFPLKIKGQFSEHSLSAHSESQKPIPELDSSPSSSSDLSGPEDIENINSSESVQDNLDPQGRASLREAHWIEKVMEDSRLPGIHNGSREIQSTQPFNNKPSNDQKWILALLLALLFVILTASPSYFISQKIYQRYKGYYFPTTPLWPVLLHGFIFLIVVRIILW